MVDWRSQLKQLSYEAKERDGFKEDPIDKILRIALGSRLRPNNGEVVAWVLRNHREPYIAREVGTGLLLYIHPDRGLKMGVTERGFVGVRVTGNYTKDNGTPYGVGYITTVFGG